jgi:hypothetical protein
MRLNMMTMAEQVDAVWEVAKPGVLVQMKARLRAGARYDRLVCLIAAGPERLPLVSLAIRRDAWRRLSSGDMKLGTTEILAALVTLRMTPRRRGLMTRLIYLLDPGPPLPDVSPGKWWGDHVAPPPAIALMMSEAELAQRPGPTPQDGHGEAGCGGGAGTKLVGRSGVLGISAAPSR